MRQTMHGRMSLTLAVASLILSISPGSAQMPTKDIDAAIHDYLAAHPDELGEIVKRYLIKHPEVLRDMFIELMKRRNAAKADTQVQAQARAAALHAAIARYAAVLFDSPHQVVLGNPAGDVTLVEFFDYSCGFCKRALADTVALLDGDPKLKIVLKEFPILGPGSMDAARVAIAVRMQDKTGQKYLAFHRQLLSEAGPADKEKALAAAAAQGLDIGRIEADMNGAEAQATLAESFELSKVLGLRGTPSYVIGDQVLQGTIGAARLRGDIEFERQHHSH